MTVQDVLWTEVTEPPEATPDRNTFVVQVNRYRDGDITPYRETVRLRHDAGRGVVLVSADTTRQRVESATAHGRTCPGRDLRKFPRSTSDITLPVKDQLPEGGRLRALCRLEVLVTGRGEPNHPTPAVDQDEPGMARESDLDPDAGSRMSERAVDRGCSKY
jgi:hypothetical protein